MRHYYIGDYVNNAALIHALKQVKDNLRDSSFGASIAYKLEKFLINSPDEQQFADEAISKLINIINEQQKYITDIHMRVSAPTLFGLKPMTLNDRENK